MEVVRLWDSDESDADLTKGQNMVHVINMTNRSSKKKKDKKKNYAGERFTLTKVTEVITIFTPPSPFLNC